MSPLNINAIEAVALVEPTDARDMLIGQLCQYARELENAALKAELYIEELENRLSDVLIERTLEIDKSGIELW